MRKLFCLALLANFLFAGCNPKPREVKEIDFSETAPEGTTRTNEQGGKVLKGAVSAILSPKETYNSYEQIFKFISNRIGLEIEFHQRKTYKEINQMLEKGQLDFAFICSGAYIDLLFESGVELLCVPICNGKPLYQAYIIVPAKSDANKLEDLLNKSFAYTDPLSNTGYLYALHRLNQMGTTSSNFFSSTLFTNGHDISIQMVTKGLVNGATVDGLVYDYLKEKEPNRVKDIRIIEKSDYFGIPPIVVSSRLDPETRNQISEIFLNMHKDKQARDLINGLLIEKFVEGNDSSYNSIREMRMNLMSK